MTVTGVQEDGGLNLGYREWDLYVYAYILYKFVFRVSGFSV